MNLLTKQIIQSAVVGFLLPALLLMAVLGASAQSPPTETAPSGSKVTLPRPTTQPTQVQLPLFLPVLHQGNVENWDIEEYLVGVLLAEMPADFEMEALKAQAVAARTYALKCHHLGYKHKGAICTEGTCCQGYLLEEEYMARGGTREGVDKIREAVLATAGEVLVYEGELIVATYFSCSGGSTEDASAVWGQEYPYLQAVPSPGEEYATCFSDEKSFTPQQLQSVLGLSMESDPESWLGEMTHTEGAGVDTLLIGGVSYRGTTLRSLLGLRSTQFTVEFADGRFIFSTLGYGHRVGMSQYGADAMAKGGSGYRDILLHYYRGTELVQMDLEKIS